MEDALKRHGATQTRVKPPKFGKPNMKDVIALSIATTGYLAQIANEPTLTGLMEKGGAWGAFLAVLWWMMTKLDRKLDELGKGLADLASAIKELK